MVKKENHAAKVKKRTASDRGLIAYVALSFYVLLWRSTLCAILSSAKYVFETLMGYIFNTLFSLALSDFCDVGGYLS